MSMELSKYASAVLLLVSSGAYADSGWTDVVHAAELVSTARHYYEVKLPVTVNPSDCKERNWFYQDYDTPGSEFMYKTLLDGIKSGIGVRVYLTGKCNINGYAEISSVSISAK